MQQKAIIKLREAQYSQYTIYHHLQCGNIFDRICRPTNIEKFLSGPFPGQSRDGQDPKGRSLRPDGPKVEAEGRSEDEVLMEGQ